MPEKQTKPQLEKVAAMKSSGLKLLDIASWQQLRLAWHDYRRGKRRRPQVAAFELDADRHLLHLSQRLLSQSWRPGAYRLLQIREPKLRLIAVAPVADRIVQTAFHHRLSPLFNRSLISDCYACLRQRGSHRAMFRFQEFMRKYTYLLHLDIKNYYPSVDHAILLAILQRRLRDQGLKDVLGLMLQSGEMIYRNPTVRAFFRLAPSNSQTRAQGLPIGNLTSQWWANAYLNGMDHFCKRILKVGGYLRYMDDFVLFANDRAQLHQWRNELGDWLSQERKLALKYPCAPVKSCRKPHLFLGYTISRGGFEVGPKIKKRFMACLSANAGNLEKLSRSLVAYRGVLFV